MDAVKIIWVIIEFAAYCGQITGDGGISGESEVGVRLAAVDVSISRGVDEKVWMI